MQYPSPAACSITVPAAQSLKLTDHARIRLQQRGIPGWFLDLLVDHGRTHHDRHGAVIKTVDKSTRRQLQSVLSRTQYVAAERYFGVYAVLADQAVVTAAYRTRRRHLH